MRHLGNTVYRIVVVCAFLILLFSFTCGRNSQSLYFKQVFRTDDTKVYMVLYRSVLEYEEITCFRDKKQYEESHFLRYEGFNSLPPYPSKETIKYELERTFPWGFTTDSVGVYSKVDNEIVAMFYSKVMEAKGKVSSTNYTNPFLREYWEVQFDEHRYAEKKWNTSIGTLTFILKKLKE